MNPGPGAEAGRWCHGLAVGRVFTWTRSASLSYDGLVTRRTKARLEEIFDAAMEKDASRRASFVARECGDNRELYHEVLALVRCASLDTPSLFTPVDRDDEPWGVDSGQGEGEPVLQSGDRIARYEIVEQIGRGGMGAVYLARDRNLRRPVAIKVLHAGTDALSDRLVREARATARCRHENIVVIHDAGEHAGRPYLVLEHLDGESLSDRRPGARRWRWTTP